MYVKVFHMLRHPDLWIFRTRLGVDQGFFTFPLVIPLSFVRGFPGNAKVPASLGNIMYLLAIV
jgi:hypothetical protein